MIDIIPKTATIATDDENATHRGRKPARRFEFDANFVLHAEYCQKMRSKQRLPFVGGHNAPKRPPPKPQPDDYTSTKAYHRDLREWKKKATPFAQYFAMLFKPLPKLEEIDLHRNFSYEALHEFVENLRRSPSWHSQFRLVVFDIRLNGMAVHWKNSKMLNQYRSQNRTIWSDTDRRYSRALQRQLDEHGRLSDLDNLDVAEANAQCAVLKPGQTRNLRKQLESLQAFTSELKRAAVLPTRYRHQEPAFLSDHNVPVIDTVRVTAKLISRVNTERLPMPEVALVGHLRRVVEDGRNCLLDRATERFPVLGQQQIRVHAVQQLSVEWIDASVHEKMLENNVGTRQQPRRSKGALHEKIQALFRTDELNAHQIGHAVFLKHFLDGTNCYFRGVVGKQDDVPVYFVPSVVDRPAKIGMHFSRRVVVTIDGENCLFMNVRRLQPCDSMEAAEIHATCYAVAQWLVPASLDGVTAIGTQFDCCLVIVHFDELLVEIINESVPSKVAAHVTWNDFLRFELFVDRNCYANFFFFEQLGEVFPFHHHVRRQICDIVVLVLHGNIVCGIVPSSANRTARKLVDVQVVRSSDNVGDRLCFLSVEYIPLNVARNASFNFRGCWRWQLIRQVLAVQMSSVVGIHDPQSCVWALI